MNTIDFETEGIVGNPIVNPPKPVGVSIKYGDKPSEYYAWGHPTRNNCQFPDAKKALLTALEHADRGPQGWLAHNNAFERSILRKYFDYTAADPLKVHDTQYELFLMDPYSWSYALKSNAEKHLGIPPDEQDELKAWIIAHVPEARQKPSEWGAYICRAPGDLVGKYAGDSKRTGVPGDTDRTWLLHQHLMPQIEEGGMLEAYQREQLLAPILQASSLRGVRLDSDTLAQDHEVYLAAQQICEKYIFSVLGEFDMDKPAQLASALDKAGQIVKWVYTPTGKKSTARRNLVGNVKAPKLMDYVSYFGVLKTCLGTFARPWLLAAQADGRLHAQWNQVRGERGKEGDIDGTRTGRLSCKQPNLTNIPNDFEGLVIPPEVRKFIDKMSKLYGRTISYIPLMRRYMLPEEGHVWIKRDFSAQEMRIMAHFAEGKLYDAFHEDPSTDPHAAVKAIIQTLTGIDLPRKYVKITGFGIMYGRGVPNLSNALGVPVEEGKRVRDAYFAALPEVRELSRSVSHRGRRGGAIKTWGGRRYFREPDPQRDFSYKLLNYLIQGSAADQTKQSLVDWDSFNHQDEAYLTAAVHDEINLSVPEEHAAYHMNVLRDAMDKDRFDVPFQSEGFLGPNWADIEKEE